MKKIKLSLLAVAILAIASAFAPTSGDPCDSVPLFVKNTNGSMIPFVIGTGTCTGDPEPCKYYLASTDPDVYEPCDSEIYGAFRWVPKPPTK